MKKDWRIKHVPEETRKLIKQNAKANGLLIGEYLGLLVEAPSEFQSGPWTIRNVSGHTRQKLVKNSRLHNQSLGDYLAYLVNEDDKDARADYDLRKIVKVLRRYGKI